MDHFDKKLVRKVCNLAFWANLGIIAVDVIMAEIPVFWPMAPVFLASGVVCAVGAASCYIVLKHLGEE